MASTAVRIQEAIVAAVEAGHLIADVNHDRERVVVMAMDGWQARFSVSCRLWGTSGEIRVSGEWVDDLVEAGELEGWDVTKLSRVATADGHRYRHEVIVHLTYGRADSTERLMWLVRRLAATDKEARV